MIKRLIRVPKNECYYFCKRLFFSISGNAQSCFAECLNQQGWLVYPYQENNEVDPNILIFTNKYLLEDQINFLNDSENGKLYTKYKLGIIITDIEDISEEYLNFFDDIIDISSLQDYYQTELSLDTFKSNLFNTMEDNPVD